MPARGHATAPKFSPDKPRELRYYFKELDHLFTASTVTDEQKMKDFATRYLDFEVADLWENVAEFKTGSYEDFKKAILKLYPGSGEERKWTMADLDKLIGEQLRIGLLNLADFGTYHRSFVQITMFLIDKKRLATEEQSRTFIRGIQPALWERIKRRLEIKVPDNHPDDPYTLDQITEAAEYVLYDPNNATSTTRTLSATDSALTTSAAPPVKQEDMAATLQVFIQALERTFERSIASISNGNRQSPAQQATVAAITQALVCFMCGEPGHGVKDCEVTQELIRNGECKINSDSKVVLPNGQFVPRAIPGKLLRERIKEWHRRNPGQITTTQSSMMYAVTPPQSAFFQEEPQEPVVTCDYTAAEEIQLLERQILALRSGKRYDGVEILRKPRVPPVPEATPQPQAQRDSSPSSSSTSANPVAQDNSTSDKATQPSQKRAAPPNVASVSTPTTDNITNAPVHPFADKRSNYLPPQNKNFASPQKSDPAYKTLAPIQDHKVLEDVYKRSMSSPCVTLTPNELLSISPEVRQKVREAITPKRQMHNNPPVGVHTVTIDSPLPTVTVEEINNPTIDNRPTNNPDPHIDGIVVPDVYETYLSRLAPGNTPEVLTVAKDSHSLRAINIHVNNQESVEAILDAGCEIVAMSEAVCHDLGIIYDPRIKINMESANGELDPSLGLARNVACQIGEITLYLQFHIIRSPAYDILLGRPFDVLTESMIKNYANENQTITIIDPNFDQRVTIPTQPRGIPKHRCMPKTKSKQDFRPSKL
jgi:hypothetical protein